MIAGSLFTGSAAFAANHPLTQVQYNEATGITYLDQVVAIDWDINSPPTLAIDGVDTLLDRAYIANVMNAASDLLYTMTEGKMRLGKISVYSNQFLDNADVLIFNKDGRANANINGMNFRGARNQMFTIGFGTAYKPAALGQVIAHEYGHYVLGIYDEYREVGQMDISSPGRPQDRDTEKSTIMKDQHSFSNMSLPADYADALARQTAHFRFYGQSAWETVIADPKNDTLTISNNWPRRYWFDSFKNMRVPTALSLPKNTVASRSDMRIAHMSGTSRTVIVIDLGVNAENLKGFVNAAEGVIDAVNGGSSVSVLTIAGSQVNVLVPLTKLPDSAKKEATRVQIKASLAALAATNSPSGALDAALAQAAVIASPLAAARADATKAGTALPLSNAVEMTQTPIISLFATNTSSLKPETTVLLTKGSVMLNSMLLNTGGAEGNLGEAAGASRGRSFEVKSAADMAKKAVQITNETEGDSLQTITGTGIESLAAGAKLTMKTPIGSSAIDGDVFITAYTGENTGIEMTLTTPAKGTVTVANAIAFGITAEVDAEEGTTTFTIPKTLAARAGEWIATLTTSKAITEPITMDASVKSMLSVKTHISGGTVADPRTATITTTLSQPMAVKGAMVTATIYDTNHTIIKSGLVLKDDGVAPDLSPGDGIYTVSLADIVTKAGEYEVDIDVSNDGLSAKYGTGGSRIRGSNVADVPITQNFLREDSITFVFAPAAAAAVAASSSSSGGCTLGHNSPFDPVFPLLVGAAGLYLYRRNRKN